MAHEVLVVEDDREINELVGAYVEIAGFGYRAATSGAEAIEQVRRRKPSLIVLDLMLPDTSGLEVCRELKGEKETAKIPIVMLTALDREEHRRRGEQCGAAAYITKPFDPDMLMETIRKTVRRGGNGAGREIVE